MTTTKLPLKDFELYQGKELIMRLGIGLTLFLPRPFANIRHTIWDVWQKYVALVGKERLTWARLGGGNRSRLVNPSTFRTIESWLTGTRDHGKHCWISIHDGLMDSLGQYSFVLEGFGEAGEDDEDVGSLEMYFPAEWLDSIDGIALAERFESLAAKVPFYCGMAGFCFHRSPFKYEATIAQMAALSKRFLGVEVTASHKEQYWASKGLVSMNWMTFLGEALVAKLGGGKALIAKLPPGSVGKILDKGIAIRSGDVPLVGDKNKGRDELGLWRRVYKVLRPIQFVDSSYEFHPFLFDGEQTAEWLQRFGS
jgi:hypothetical protein